jgi:peroxiredoxin
MIAQSTVLRRRGGLAAIVIAVAAACLQGGGARAADDAADTAPAFTLEDVAGDRVALATALARGPVIVEFWATWCGPCRQALPGLQRLHEAYASRGLTVLAVSTDEPRNRPKIGSTARALGLTFPVLVDADKRVAQLYRVESIPMTFLIDRDGRIRSLHRGYRPGDLEALEQELLPLLDAADGVKH